jgi:hypothetical protein
MTSKDDAVHQGTITPPRKPGWLALARLAYFAGAGTFKLTDAGWERQDGKQS